jgi:hypothetical protein
MTINLFFVQAVSFAVRTSIWHEASAKAPRLSINLKIENILFCLSGILITRIAEN